jgi:hypothetical protein
MITVAASRSRNARPSRRSSNGHVSGRSKSQPRHQRKPSSAFDVTAFAHSDLIDPRFLDHSEESTRNTNSHASFATI